jgi:hypothetical protein
MTNSEILDFTCIIPISTVWIGEISTFGKRIPAVVNPLVLNGAVIPTRVSGCTRQGGKLPTITI